LNPECMSHAGTYWRILRINHDTKHRENAKTKRVGPTRSFFT
jgi:hypothetical protein